MIGFHYFSILYPESLLYQLHLDIETDEKSLKLPGFKCQQCGSYYKSIQSHRTNHTDVVFQIITCYECKYSWKERWYQANWQKTRH